MTRERWQQIENVFEQIVDLAPTERIAFLEKSCDGDDDLRREVQSLLDAHVHAGSFIDDRSRFHQQFETDAPQLIGHYRTVRELGRGGMGAVYLAERADEYKKRVAIKLIKRGMDTDSVLRRFRNERQILAGFDHPNIARLFDGGTTEDGLPYFVMEYIEGLPIDQYCSKHSLAIPERVRLFREVCAAVAYAHQHLVIHRDIKRSNILVTSDGIPKLLDFGIAKILQSGEAEPTFATMTGLRLMTLEYASPEQVRGQPVTTTSDVYSLGVILYELLTGQFPYRFESQTPHDIERAITTSQPEKPSTAIRHLRNQSRKPADSRFTLHDSRALRGDLDNIVLMALRKEPARRYQSVEQISDDLRRYLEARPVLARKDTFGYRTGKFIARNKVALAAAALIFLSLVGGIVATTIQTYRARQQKALAERRFNDVRKLSHSVLFDYHDAIKSLPAATKVRERLVKDALSYLDSLAAEAHGDPALQRELADGYERVGDVRGGTMDANLGDTTGAVESYKKALRIREDVAVANPYDPKAQRDLARGHHILGDAQVGIPEEADAGFEHLRKAAALYRILVEQQPKDLDLHFDLAATHNELALAMKGRNDLPGAIEQYRAGISISEKLVAARPEERRFRHLLWACAVNMASALWSKGDAAAAIEANGEAVRVGEALNAQDPSNTTYRQHLALNYGNAANYRFDSNKTGALEFLRRAIKLEEELIAADPANMPAKQHFAEHNQKMAELLATMGDNAQALVFFDKAAATYDQLSATASKNSMMPMAIVICRIGAAGVQARLGQIDNALAQCRQSVAHLQQIPDDTSDTNLRRHRALAYEYLGYAYQALANRANVPEKSRQGYLTSARDAFRQSLSIFDDVRNVGGLDAPDSREAKTVADELAKCESRLR